MSLLPDLTLFTDRWTPAQRRRAAIAGSVITIPISVLVALWMGNIFTQADTLHYLALAKGQPAALPFASRQLGPLLVRGLVYAFHVSIAAAFYAEGAVSWAIFFATSLWFLLRSGAPRFMIAATLGLLFWTHQFNQLVVPDLLYAALLCIFLLLLERRSFLLAALMMFPLTVCRESTILTLVCFLIAGWRRLRIPEAAVAILSMMAGSALVKRLAADALPNNEHISPTLYLLAKMPWAFVKNFLGILPWANVYPECAVPQWQTRVHLGPLTAIGSCGFDHVAQRGLIFFMLASFGLFPVLILALGKHFPWTLIQNPTRHSVLMRFAIIYGVVSFLLAGLLGESFYRLFAYAWPLFIIALPKLMATSRATFRSNTPALLFLAVHLLVGWSDLRFFQPRWIPLQVALWVAGFVFLRRALIFAPQVSADRTISSVPVTNSAL